MPARLDPEELMFRARRALASRALSGTELASSLDVSQPTISRLLREHSEEILTIGKARRTRHILRRSIPSVDTPLPIYEIDERGRSRRIAVLHPVGANGFHVESACEDVDDKTYEDWPWFLHQLRPGGFLGRRMSARFPTLELPDDPRNWSADQLLRFLGRGGAHGSGALLIGERALESWLQEAESKRRTFFPSKLYPSLVADVYAGAPPGSSAEGEQPKFLVARSEKRPELLVKFSPPADNIVGRRVADLLVAEHHALATLSAAGISSANSSIVTIEGRTFLEVERFDRTATGRRGLLSLEAFDSEFVGRGERNRWPTIVKHLIDRDVVPASVRDVVDRLHAFGHLIGNDDMHTGNLSFLVRGHRALGVAPAYDMASMYFAPLRGEVPERTLPITLNAEVPRSSWAWAIEAALRMWRRVTEDPRVSPEFRVLARDCAARVEKTHAHLERLPE